MQWKAGFEIELLVPRGRSRSDLAQRVAERHGGSVVRFLHPQSEPSKAKDTPTFANLTPGFEARNQGGQPLARFVDDLTLQAGLDRKAAARPGWWRIVTDDRRLLHLAMRHCQPEANLESALQPLAALFGTALDHHTSGMVKVVDEQGLSVAIAAPLPGERERTCELITPPLEADHEAALALLLAEARAEGCTLPLEGATHIHFDAAPLTSAAVIARLVSLLSAHGEALKQLVGTNPHCIRLGRWPEALLSLVSTPAFAALAWPAARKALSGVGLSKYCDFNLLNIAGANSGKHTFEVRILPATLEAAPLIDAAELFAALLAWCCQAPLPLPADLHALIAVLPLPPRARLRWTT